MRALNLLHRDNARRSLETRPFWRDRGPRSGGFSGASRPYEVTHSRPEVAPSTVWSVSARSRRAATRGEESLMAFNDVTIAVERAESARARRRPTRRMIAIGATTLVVAIVSMAAVVQNSDDQTSEPAVQPAPQSRDGIVQDLADRGLIPRQTPQPAPLSHDGIVQDLADRGLIPRQTPQPAPLSRDGIVQDLADRGLIPRPRRPSRHRYPATASSKTSPTAASCRQRRWTTETTCRKPSPSNGRDRRRRRG